MDRNEEYYKKLWMHETSRADAWLRSYTQQLTKVMDLRLGLIDLDEEVRDLKAEIEERKQYGGQTLAEYDEAMSLFNDEISDAFKPVYQAIDKKLEVATS